MSYLKERAERGVVTVVGDQLVSDVPANSQPVADVMTAKPPRSNAGVAVFQESEDLEEGLFPRGIARKSRRRFGSALLLSAHISVSLANYSMVIQRGNPRGLVLSVKSNRKGRRMADIASLVERFHAIDWNFPDSNSAPDVHPYPARFIPEIPAAALELLDPEGPVLDPFCGSGTTLVEALRYGLPAVGVDLNPIACLIARVKVGEWRVGDPEVLGRHRDGLVDAALEGNSRLLRVVKEQIPRLDHWFSSDAQEVLAGAVGYLDEVDESDRWHDRLALAISASTVRIGRQESDTRYAAVDKPMTRDKAAQELGVSLERIGTWFMSSGVSGEAAVHCRDAQQLDFLPEGEAGAAIFSPPYPNAYEYWLYHKYRMYWLGFDPISVRTNEIGARPHYVGPSGLDEHDFGRQMRDVLRGLHRALRPKAHVLVVIGDSRIRGRIVDNGQLFQDIAVSEGFKPTAHTRRAIRRSKTSFNHAHSSARTHEHVILMEREA